LSDFAFFTMKLCLEYQYCCFYAASVKKTFLKIKTKTVFFCLWGISRLSIEDYILIIVYCNDNDNDEDEHIYTVSQKKHPQHFRL